MVGPIILATISIVKCIHNQNIIIATLYIPENLIN